MIDKSTDSDYQRALFEFDLPAELIAQTPAARREQARLLVVQNDGDLAHRVFADLVAYLREGDVLVLNQTKVMRARCRAIKAASGGRVEVFFLNVPVEGQPMQAMIRPAKRVPLGTQLTFPQSQVTVDVVNRMEGGQVQLSPLSLADFEQVLARDGEIPLPPYIKRQDGPSAEDERRYQTVFASDLGAVAAPTAGLHFTEPILGELKAKGVQIAKITHHVGIGTFKPMLVDDVRHHRVDQEHYSISQTVADQLNRARSDGRRIIAVGTTTTRCLESNIRAGSFTCGTYATDLYIYPGHTFSAIDALITNFHLPGSSLMVLVCALMGRDKMMAAYAEAIEHRYRFYSFGDAMFLNPSPDEDPL